MFTRMESKTYNLKLFRILLMFTYILCSYTYSDMGKISSQQNHFGNLAQTQFNTKNNTRVIAQKGGLAILPCVVKMNSPVTVSWIRRKDFQLLTVGLSTHSSDKRFLVEHTRHMGHWSLRIKSVKEEDRGFYECQLSIYPTQSIFVELKVVEAVAEISGAPDLHIDESSTLRLECKLKRATENPAFVFWYHDNKMVNYDTQGGFSVTASSFSGLTAADNALQRPSTAISSLKTRDLSANASMNNHLSANSSVNSHSVSTSHLVASTHQSSYLLTPSTSILTIKEVNFHHAGNYTCAPSNARPSSITVHVLRGEKPAAMQHANRSLLDSEGNNNNNTMGLSGAINSIRHSSHFNIIVLFGLKISYFTFSNYTQQSKNYFQMYIMFLIMLILAALAELR